MPQSLSLLLSTQFACSVGKPCCKNAGSFQLVRNDFLLHNKAVRWEVEVICNVLSLVVVGSKVIPYKETVMEKGTISYGVITFDGK